jgi:hypothetical protein
MTDKKGVKEPKAPKSPKAAKTDKYDRDLIVRLFEKGMRPCEIAVDGRDGVKGISPVYVSRVLFGSKNSGGVSADQAARVKEADKRAKARVAEREAEAKKAKDAAAKS